MREWDLGTKLDSLVKDHSVDRVPVEGRLSIDNKDVSATSTPDTSTPSVAELVPETSEIPETPAYTIKSGDTLSSILKEQIPEIKTSVQERRKKTRLQTFCADSRQKN